MGRSVGGYELGVDLGTTYTGAAVARGEQVEMVGLGNRATVVPSVLYVGADDVVSTGEGASRRASAEPGRVAREFKRRVGDPTPLLVAGHPYSAEALTAKLLRATIDTTVELEGSAPDALVVTHPANWGPYKQDLLGQAIRMAGTTATLLTEPEAAAISYARNERVEPGALVAVYDLGGGTFDAAVLRKTGDGFDILGQPEGIERLGGIDFDEAVVGHVRDALGDTLDDLDPDDAATDAALARLRRECVEAKEALSADTSVAVPVTLPGVQTEVRLTRTEFEQMIRPTLAETVAALERALDSAGIEPAAVSAVLLVGGSSRIPLVAELLSDAIGRPIAVDAHPKHAVALGAAHAAALRSGRVARAAASSAKAGIAAAAAVDAAGDRDASVAAAQPSDARVPEVADASAATPAHAAPSSADGVSAAAARAIAEPTDNTSGPSDAPVPPPWQPPTPARSGGGKARWLAIVGAVLVLGAAAVGAGALAGGDPAPGSGVASETAAPTGTRADARAGDDAGDTQRHSPAGSGGGSAAGGGQQRQAAPPEAGHDLVDPDVGRSEPPVVVPDEQSGDQQPPPDQQQPPDEQPPDDDPPVDQPLPGQDDVPVDPDE